MRRPRVAHEPGILATIGPRDGERADFDPTLIMAAALIDRLVHHCHLVTIRGNSYRMRQHSELWQTLHTAHEPESSGRRGRRTPPRQEATTT